MTLVRFARSTTRTTTRAATRLLATAAIATLCIAPALQASADSLPTTPGTPATVSADPLPTVQVDGVVWSQAVVGNTVYAAGSFKTARPAGAAAGTQTTVRNNLLAYDITTGNLITSFAPNLNGQALVVSASPDGKRIYVGGQFTLANGVARSRIAAYDTATGQLVSAFAPSAASTVRTITATNTTVYFGGDFTQVNGTARNYLAAVNATNGALLALNPKPNAQLTSSTLTGDGSKLIIGGRFTTVGTTAAYGMAALNPTTGAVLPWAVNTIVKNAGANAAITSLTADATGVYGTGYHYSAGGPGGNFEGTFRADAATGNVTWLEDCHGDTYSAFATAAVVYVASHAHSCATLGAWKDTKPETSYRATAFTNKATGVVGTNTDPNYANFAGKPAPTLLHFFPTLWIGSYTGQGQAAWSVTGNSQYVVYAGEFTAVNTTNQQGIVRFAVPSIAPNKVRPTTNTAALTPKVTSTTPGKASISWTSTWDRDNASLTYKVYRNYTTIKATPTCVVTNNSPAWKPTSLSCVDSAAPAGQTVTYQVLVFDDFGNQNNGAATTVTIAK